MFLRAILYYHSISQKPPICANKACVSVQQDDTAYFSTGWQMFIIVNLDATGYLKPQSSNLDHSNCSKAMEAQLRTTRKF